MKEYLFKELIDLKTNPLLFVLENNLVEKGTWLEFGVFRGHTINKISSYTADKVYGFDSFEGLPGMWEVDEHTKINQGHYSYKSYAEENNLNPIYPTVNDNVVLISGLFSETLPDFISDQKVTFIHIDCDLYSSTKDIFDNITPNIADGCVIVFDELVNYPNYKRHELLAFEEWIKENNIEYEFIGMNGKYVDNPQKVFPASTQKVAVRISNNPGCIHG